MNIIYYQLNLISCNLYDIGVGMLKIIFYCLVGQIWIFNITYFVWYNIF